MFTAYTVGGGISHDHRAKEHLGRGDSERVSLLSLWPYAVWEEMQLKYDACAQNKRPNKNKQQSVGPPTHPTERLSTAFKNAYILAPVTAISLDVKSSLKATGAL